MSVDLNRFADLMAIFMRGEKLTKREQKELEEIIRRLSFLVQGMSGNFDSQGNVVVNNITQILGEWFNKITVYHADKAPAEFFDIDNAGLMLARSASRIGDRMHIPAAPLGDLTVFLDVPPGVKIDGAGTLITYIGRVQLNSGSFLRDLSSVTTYNNSLDKSGVTGPTSGNAYLNTVHVSVTQAGSGDAQAIEVGAGNVWARESSFTGNSTGGSGYGVKSGAGDCYLSEGTTLAGSTRKISGTNVFKMDSDKLIHLQDIDGTYDWIFPFDATGVAAAITAVESGDVIKLPAGTAAGNHTIAAGTEVRGLGKNTILTGTITNNGILNNVNLAVSPHINSTGLFLSVIVDTGNIINGTVADISNASGSTTNYNVMGGGANSTIDTQGTHGPNATNYNFIGGGDGQYIQSASYGVVCGGYSNEIYGNYCFVGGGYDNTVFHENDYSVICGGYDNAIGGGASPVVSLGKNFIGAGNNNYIDDSIHGSIVGGWANQMDGDGSELDSAFIGGGDSNEIVGDSDYSAIVAGERNVITAATHSVITGGLSSDILTGAHYAFAQGRRAQVAHSGATLFADSTNADFDSAAANEFAIRSGGGTRIVVATDTAAGISGLRVTMLQGDNNAMTGTLRGAYIDVSNGSQAATGTIRGLEIKARTEAPGDVGNDVTVLEGLSISADSKDHSVTTMRAIEAILDGSTGGTITEAVGIRIANNLQANKATTSYGLQIYRDSFEYTADIQLSSGGLIGGAGGHLRVDSDGNVSIHNNDEFRFYDNGNYVGFEAPSLSADQIWILPAADGDAKDFLQTSGSGALSWTAVAGGAYHDGFSDFAAGEHFTMLDEDDMATNSATQAATQQSIKAYVDTTTIALGLADWDTLWADAVHSHQSDAEGSVLTHAAMTNLTLTTALTNQGAAGTLIWGAAATLTLAITATKTLTLTCADDYNLTIPASGTAALLGTANIFTAEQIIGDATGSPILTLNKDEAGAGYIYFKREGTVDWAIYESTSESLYFRGYKEDEDFFIQINDGGVNTTVMRVDASVPAVYFPVTIQYHVLSDVTCATFKDYSDEELIDIIDLQPRKDGIYHKSDPDAKAFPHTDFSKVHDDIAMIAKDDTEIAEVYSYNKKLDEYEKTELHYKEGDKMGIDFGTLVYAMAESNVRLSTQIEKLNARLEKLEAK